MLKRHVSFKSCFGRGTSETYSFSVDSKHQVLRMKCIAEVNGARYDDPYCTKVECEADEFSDASLVIHINVIANDFKVS